MPVREFRLLSFSDMMLLEPGRLAEGSLEWLLREYSAILFPAWLFEGWRGQSSTGCPAWPAPLLMGLLLLRYAEPGQTRVGAVRRLANDAAWRAALRLPWNNRPPHEKTLREFETFLKADHPVLGVPRTLVVFEHWTRLCLQTGMVGDQLLPVIDSTPMWCYGAVLDTVNLLGEGLRSLGRRWARARGVPVATVATEWGLPLLLAKSTKGQFEGTDWSDARARAGVLAQLAKAALDAVERVTAALDSVRENKRVPLARRCKTLLRIVDEDLEADEHGLRVVRRQTSKRLISLTDPDAQHFRKSESQVCSGFKLHVLGDAASGLILALSVTPGGQHDGTQAHPLVARAQALLADIREVIADSAYGRMPTRHAVRALGVTLLAPPPPAGRPDTLGKKDFPIDFDTMVATCPGGVASSGWKYTKNGGKSVPTFCWSVGSEHECTRRAHCPVHRPSLKKPGREPKPRRRLQIHPDEQELRRLRAEWETRPIRRRYRLRSQGERLIFQMTRRGARRASAWGIRSAELQAHCIAAVNNLLLLAKRLSADPVAA